MSIERSHLQLLAALREFGRLGDAARSLHLSPSAASHRLAEAERRVGVRLTETHGRTLRLTVAGEHLAAGATEIERSIERLALTTRWAGTAEPIRIRVGVGFYDTVGWLLDTFAPSGDAPRLELLRFSDEGLLGALRTNQIDIAIAPWPKAPSGLKNVPLGHDRLVAAVPSESTFSTGSPVSAAELCEHTFLTSDYRATRGFEFHDFFLAADIVPRTVVQVQSLEMMLRLVGHGDGVTIQPSRVLRWNRPHHDIAVLPLTGREIQVQWIASHQRSANDDVALAAARIADAFAAQAAQTSSASS